MELINAIEDSGLAFQLGELSIINRTGFRPRWEQLGGIARVRRMVDEQIDVLVR